MSELPRAIQPSAALLWEMRQRILGLRDFDLLGWALSLYRVDNAHGVALGVLAERGEGRRVEDRLGVVLAAVGDVRLVRGVVARDGVALVRRQRVGRDTRDGVGEAVEAALRVHARLQDFTELLDGVFVAFEGAPVGGLKGGLEGGHRAPARIRGIIADDGDAVLVALVLGGMVRGNRGQTKLHHMALGGELLDLGELRLERLLGRALISVLHPVDRVEIAEA
mmetsp:Transcript_65740/g.146716  ORF Transcript_65740/g.146716 Transcript_65740/m.146716 type:complete len:223 (-) Transcript_65740:209-877(-)